MATNFFEHQDAARKRTGRLVILFGLAVIAITIMVYLLVAGVIVYVGSQQAETRVNQPFDWSQLLRPELLLGVGLGTLVLIGGGSLYKIAQLRGGGSVIAEELGGVRLYAETADKNGRKLLNVVEEMAIASGTPVPPVYLLAQERGINAFAAGHSPSDAVIGVTAGAVERLNREELQGVIAHEFSHILNGDMRLNIRLIGVLNGILIIGIIGYTILRSMMYTGHSRQRSNSKGGNGAIVILALGGGLAVIGFAGTFFGNLIKAAVSRQREFLADASAVQFTRNPEGIGDALKRIGGFSVGSRIASPNAPEASHMFFGQGISSFTAFFATHPPMAERIRRLLPSWDGEFIQAEEGVESAAAVGLAGAAGMAGVAGLAGAQPVSKSPQAKPPRAKRVQAKRAKPSAIDHIGQPTEAHLAYAGDLVKRLPESVKDAARQPYGARAVIYALLINADPDARQIQLQRLAQHADPGVNDVTNKLLPLVAKLDAAVRLPLVDMTLPALRDLTADQYRAFIDNIDELVKADQHMDLFEWALHRILMRHLAGRFTKIKQPRVQYYALKRLQSHCEVLLSTLAFVGQDDVGDARKAFAQGAAQLHIPRMSLASISDCGLDAVDRALDVLVTISPKLKRQLLTACAACISADREITVHEAELFRAVADSLDCPMPPLLPGQPLV